MEIVKSMLCRTVGCLWILQFREIWIFRKFCHYRIIYDITDKSGSHYINADGFRQGQYIPFPDFKPEIPQITFRFPKEDY
ncbi:Protein CBG04447 [Caenorhabditis briggsae]|uniref:Protein CBG04447 n=1 Tax=Caenorhabditis briggsae TaxID=6238 RepID=B0K070_CAEBR|nr:Protein CBG04447 [Caenorhabditis briggsae]CAP25145.4 Protein CBG04447 [Caenorhabditis briggsae]